MSQLTYVELSKKVIEEEKRPLSQEEIWDIAKQKGYDKFLASIGKTPWRTIGSRIYVNMIEMGDKSYFYKVDTSPRRFYLRNLGNPPKEIIETQKKSGFLEKDLHPFLTYFAYYYLQAYTKTIIHTKAIGGAYGEWVHPDIVGSTLSNWKPEVVDLCGYTRNSPVKLYSFELKRELNFANLRAVFFQAVSNSSWANEGYLVAASILDDEEFDYELKRLSQAFGIGIIRLNIEDPDSSSIIYPAKTKSDLDWETINKLAKMDPDFDEFIIRVKNDIQIKEVRKEAYDKILEREDLIKSIKRNQI